MTEAEIQKHRSKIRKLSNNARFDECYRLSRKLMIENPDVLLFAYMEAVFTAEDEPSKHKLAAKKLKKLMPRMRKASESLRYSIRNEYYWFSHQPYKQYRLGLERMRRKNRGGAYSAGVGACELAREYGLAGRMKLSLKWAREAERCWLKFFKVDANWYNSYFFYATALGLQGRVKEMEKALQRAAKIARKPRGWSALREVREQVAAVLNS